MAEHENIIRRELKILLKGYKDAMEDIEDSEWSIEEKIDLIANYAEQLASIKR